MNVVVFDFDKTLTEKDTFNQFLYYFGKINNDYLIKRIFYLVIIILRKLRLITNITQKQSGLNLFLKDDLNSIQIRTADFCNTIKLNKRILDIFNEKSTDSRMIICSASPEIYIKSLFPTAEVIGLTFIQKDGHNIILKHPYKYDKLKLLKDKGIGKVNEFYTDSYSDKHIAQISEQIYVVSKNKIYSCASYVEFEKYFKRI